MKIKKNGNIITLTESDLEKILKKVLTEEKVSFKDCNKDPDLFEWFYDEGTDEGIVASSEKVGKRFHTCRELLQSDDINAGFLSKISDKGMKDKNLKKSVQYCMRTIAKVIPELEKIIKYKTVSPDAIRSLKGNQYVLKSDYFKKLDSLVQKEKEEGKDEWEALKQKWDPEEKIKQLKEVSQCLHRSYF